MALTFLLSAATGCGGGRAKPPAGPFGAYPPSPALDAVRKAHADAAADPREELLLLTTWFLDGDPQVAMMCRVRPDGHVTTFGYVHDHGLQNTRSTDLVADQLSALKAALGDLPPATAPTLENLLVVSHRRNGVWLTRTYDRTNPPAAVVDAFAITGAPLQPDPRRRVNAE